MPTDKPVEYFGVAERTVVGMAKQRDALTAKLAAAEAERDDAWERLEAAGRVASRFAEDRDAAEANLAKATAVVEAAERLSELAAVWVDEAVDNGYSHNRFVDSIDPLRDALANYHAGPAETETPGEP